jgi:hypothetical protein
MEKRRRSALGPNPRLSGVVPRDFAEDYSEHGHGLFSEDGSGGIEGRLAWRGTLGLTREELPGALAPQNDPNTEPSAITATRATIAPTIATMMMSR